MPICYKSGIPRNFSPHFTLRSPFTRKSPDSQQPLRSELFGLEQMQGHGKILAKKHTLSLSRVHGDRLLTRFVENKTFLTEVRCLNGGQSLGLPRVYDIALERISHEVEMKIIAKSN